MLQTLVQIPYTICICLLSTHVLVIHINTHPMSTVFVKHVIYGQSPPMNFQPKFEIVQEDKGQPPPLIYMIHEKSRKQIIYCYYNLTVVCEGLLLFLGAPEVDGGEKEIGKSSRRSHFESVVMLVGVHGEFSE